MERARTCRARTYRIARAYRILHLLAGVLPSLVLLACDSSTEPDPPVRYRVEVSGEAFVVEAVTEEQVAALEARLASGEEGVLSGELAAGDGGYNAPWSWHLVPGTLEAVDLAIEVCDGRPSMVEEDLDYWLGTVERFCPWGAAVIERIS